MTQPRDPEQIQRDIEQTREQLGDTVEALAGKADVKAQAKQKKDELLNRARTAAPDTAADAAGQVSAKARENPVPVAAIGAFLGGFLAGRLTKR